MKRRAHLTSCIGIALAGLVAASLAIGPAAMAQDQSAAAGADAIFARKTIMDALCDKMAEIERMIALGKIDTKVTHAHGDTISVMLMAFPHLFPPGTNKWKPDLDQDPLTETLASPNLWSSFPDFYRQATAAAKTAFALSRADKIDDIKTNARELRIECDTCHSLYLEEP
jgi:cytochrome c556